MSTDELITQAIHAIETNQPRMANLYMKNALEQTDQRRRELNPLAWQNRQMGKCFAMIGASISGIFKSFELGIARAIELEETQRKTNYALVGPSK